MTSTLPGFDDRDSRLPEVVHQPSTLRPENSRWNGYGSDTNSSSNYSSTPYPSTINDGNTQFDTDTQLLSPGGPPLLGKKFHSMSRLKFGMLMSLVVFLITAVSLGAGLGIPLAKCRNNINRTTNYDAKKPSVIQSVRWDAFCPTNSNDTPFKASHNTTFAVSCGLDFQERLIGTNGQPIRNIAVIVAYDMADCIQACSSLTATADEWNNLVKCRAVTFNRMMSQGVQALGGNCILKNSTVQNIGTAVKNDQVASAAML